jgi:chromosome segregation ATPase
MKSHNVLALLLSSVSVVGAVNAHAQVPGEVVSAMQITNNYIASDVTTISKRCAAQTTRKQFLEAEIVRRQPELANLNASKRTLETQLTTQAGLVTAKRQALATLEAEIAGLRTAIGNANTSATTLLATYKTERDAASRASVIAARDIEALDKVFEKWKESGSNEFTLFRAQLKDENNKILPPASRTPLTAAEIAALDTLRAYDTMRAQLSSVMATNDAIVAQKTTAIAELTAGRTRSIQELQSQLTQKLGLLPGALTNRDAAVRENTRIEGEIRVISARIATLSSIVIPTTPRVCAVINTLSTPQ